MDKSARIRYNNGEIKIGNFNKHLRLAKEKYLATSVAYANNYITVVGDLGTKVVEQLIEADASTLSPP
jgi:hypothetical protein